VEEGRKHGVFVESDDVWVIAMEQFGPCGSRSNGRSNGCLGASNRRTIGDGESADKEYLMGTTASGGALALKRRTLNTAFKPARRGR